MYALFTQGIQRNTPILDFLASQKSSLDTEYFPTYGEKSILSIGFQMIFHTGNFWK